MTELSKERKIELEAALKQMQAISDDFYAKAVYVNVHSFIEFTGLINEYIKACENSLKSGIDFAQCNTHTGKQLLLKSYEVAYINEKLECIFQGKSVITEDESSLL